MSAVIKQWQDPQPEPQRPPGDGIELTATLAGQEPLLTPAALSFLAGLHRRFEPVRDRKSVV